MSSDSESDNESHQLLVSSPPQPLPQPPPSLPIKYGVQNFTIIPIVWAVNWVLYFSNINNYKECKKIYGLHLSEWPVTNPQIQQDWQKSLRKLLDKLWQKAIETGTISKQYINKISIKCQEITGKARKNLIMPDYYAWEVLCLVYSNVKKIKKWEDVSIYWSRPKTINKTLINIGRFDQLNELDAMTDECACGHPISESNTIYSTTIHNQVEVENNNAIPVFRELLLGNDCINKTDIVTQVISAAKEIFVSPYPGPGIFKLISGEDSINIVETIISKDKLSISDKFIKHLGVIIEHLKKSKENAKQEDDIELINRIKKIEHFDIMIKNAEDYLIWMKKAQIRKKQKNDKRNEIEDLIISEVNQDNIVDKINKVRKKIKNVSIQKKLIKNMIEKVLLHPIKELTQETISIDFKTCDYLNNPINLPIDDLYNLVSAARENILPEIISCLKKIRKNKNEEYWQKEEAKWDNEIEVCYTDCIDNIENTINDAERCVDDELVSNLKYGIGSWTCYYKKYKNKKWGALFRGYGPDGRDYIRWCCQQQWFKNEIKDWFENCCALENRRLWLVGLIDSIPEEE